MKKKFLSKSLEWNLFCIYVADKSSDRYDYQIFDSAYGQGIWKFYIALLINIMGNFKNKIVCYNSLLT
jgi:hypothetical protein